MVKIARLDDAFSEIFKLEASPLEGQSLPQKDKKRRKVKGEKRNENLLQCDYSNQGHPTKFSTNLTNENREG